MWGAAVLLEAAGIFSSYSWSFACPAHCHSSVFPIFLAGLLSGFFLGLLAQPKPGRPLAFMFEFLEIFSGGASQVTEFLAGLGEVCGPPIDFSRSEAFNRRYPHRVAWITHLLAEKILKAVLLMPPCATFSIMRRSLLREREIFLVVLTQQTGRQATATFWPIGLSRLVWSLPQMTPLRSLRSLTPQR